MSSQSLGFLKHLQNTHIFLEHRPEQPIIGHARQWLIIHSSIVYIPHLLIVFVYCIYSYVHLYTHMSIYVLIVHFYTHMSISILICPFIYSYVHFRWLYAQKCISIHLRRSKWDWLEVKEQR